MSIEFDFDESKATQVIGILVARCSGIFDYYLAMKAIYALDRTALLRWGQPVIGGCYRMLPWGPANQSVMDATKQGRQGFFSKCFDRLGNEIHMKSDPGTDELSRAEVKLAEEICGVWKDFGFNQAHDKATSFPECSGLEGVTEISPDRILASEGRTDKQIDELAAEVAEFRLLRHGRND